MSCRIAAWGNCTPTVEDRTPETTAAVRYKVVALTPGVSHGRILGKKPGVVGVDGRVEERVDRGEDGGETPGGWIAESGGFIAAEAGGTRAGTKGIGVEAGGEPKSCR